MLDALEYADEAASAAWRAAEGQTPAERFVVAVQAAGEELDRLALAVAERTGRHRRRRRTWTNKGVR